MQLFSFKDDDEDDSDDSDDSLSDTEYPQSKTMCEDKSSDNHALLVERSFLNENKSPMGEWERHTRVSMY